MKILLTGISGFVGTSLAERLASYNEVVGVDLRKPFELVQGTTMVRGDFLDRVFLAKLFADLGPFDVVLHIAAQARVEPSLIDPIGTYRTNVEGTINLLEQAMKSSKRPKFIFASSEAIYGNADRYPTKENDHFRPITPYASSKIAADVLVQQMNSRGLDTVVLRSGMGFGERSPPSQVVTKMILRCMDGKPLLFPKGGFLKKVRHPTRDINYIQNFVGGVMALLDHPDVTGVFNLATGKETDMVTLAKLIIKTVGKGEIVEDATFRYREAEEGMRICLDISKARQAFGYSPKFSLAEGLKPTYEWLRDGGRELYGF